MAQSGYMFKEVRKLGENVRRYRRGLGFTQEVLAESVGIGPKYLSQIENGTRRPSLKLLYKLAKVLKVNPKDLL